jgi:hypothetical protein
MSSTWSSGIGKFPKKDPNHGNWWRKIRHWACKVGLCNLDRCVCDCHGNPKGRSKAYFVTAKKEELPSSEEAAPKVRKKVFNPTRGGWVFED